jgi:hypothetical protein
MLTRQQKRALARKKATRPQSESRLRRASRLALKIPTFLVGLARKLPLWADILGVLTALYVIYGIFYELVPEIQPDPAISSSWVDLPLKAKNRSLFFDMHDVQIICVVNDFAWKGRGTDEIRGNFVGGAGPRVTDAAQTIAATQTITFPCEISEHVKGYRLDGDQRTLMPLALIRLSIQIDYSIRLWRWFWPRRTTSQSFTWRAVSGGYQWLEGDTSNRLK